jgi:large subunit ribosomal protein L32
MAHPKSRISKQRKRTRRGHIKAAMPTIAHCPTTGEAHLFHRAYWHDGSLYYKGKVVMTKAVKAKEADTQE